jgi:DNA adenine methylase
MEGTKTPMKISKTNLRSPITWFGGKGMMVKKLLPLIPDHHIYVEPFGGGGSLLFAKEPSAVEVYNDLDSGLVNFFRVLRDPAKFPALLKLCRLMPFSREEFDYCRSVWGKEENDIDRAFMWYVVARMSFSGIFGGSWGHTVSSSARGMASSVSKWLSIQEILPDIHKRIMRVQIEHSDFRQILTRYDTPRTFFYIDPPYIHATRRSGGYAHELHAADHSDLVQMLLKLQGKAMLSGYAHGIYKPLEEAGWERHDFSVVCCAAGRTRTSGLQGKGAAKAKQMRTETVWLSPNCREDTNADNGYPGDGG